MTCKDFWAAGNEFKETLTVALFGVLFVIAIWLLHAMWGI